MTGPVTDFSLSILRISRDDYRKLTHDQRQRLHVYAARAWEEDSMMTPDRFRDGAGEAILCFEVASYRIDEIMAAGKIKVESQILLNKMTKNHGSYVEVFGDGKVKAGEYESSAQVFDTADAAYAYFRPMATGTSGHWAWNICYILEDYLSQRDEGR